MPNLVDFIRHRHVVSFGGKKYVCQSPTYATVVTFLEFFAVKVYGAAESFRRNPAVANVGHLANVFASEPRIAEVLETCVHVHGGAPGDVIDDCTANPGLSTELVHGVLKTCDIKRIASTLKLNADQVVGGSTPAAASETLPAIGQLLAIKDVAIQFHQSPHQVMTEWPVETLMTLGDIAPTIQLPDGQVASDVEFPDPPTNDEILERTGHVRSD